MELTYEEKLEKLKAYSQWNTLSANQKNFLVFVAEGVEPFKAYTEAYPERSKASQEHQFTLLMKNWRIKGALATIGYELLDDIANRKEILQLLTDHLRKRNIETETFLKVANTIAKMRGYIGEEEQKPKEEVSVDSVVAAIERKRRNGYQENPES